SRQTPPFAVAPIRANSIRLAHSRSPLIVRLRMSPPLCAETTASTAIAANIASNVRASGEDDAGLVSLRECVSVRAAGGAGPRRVGARQPAEQILRPEDRRRPVPRVPRRTSALR